MANLIGGRGCVSKILGAPAVAVSSPARLATETDPFGSCVVTVVTLRRPLGHDGGKLGHRSAGTPSRNC